MKAETDGKATSQASLPSIKSHHFCPLHHCTTRRQGSPSLEAESRGPGVFIARLPPESSIRETWRVGTGGGGRADSAPLAEQCTAARKPLQCCQGPAESGEGLQNLARPQGPVLCPPMHLVPSLPGTSPRVSHPYSEHPALLSDASRANPQEPLRTSSGSRARKVGPSTGESSPFEVSGVLPLHGGGDDGVGRLGVSARAISGNGGHTTPTSEGDDSPEACEAGRRRRCGYHGEAAGSSHSSHSPKRRSRRDPLRDAAAAPPQGACARSAARPAQAQ